MREYWVASGHHLTRLTASGWMAVTDELLLAWLARPEVLPPDDACPAERGLHARLMAAPRAPVAPADIAAMADPDARENWTLLIRLRDALVGAGTVEGAYLALVRAGEKLPLVFYDQLVQLILRNALDGCADVYVLRAAELFFRPQRGHVSDGALILADEELIAEMEAEQHDSPLTAMFPADPRNSTFSETTMPGPTGAGRTRMSWRSISGETPRHGRGWHPQSPRL